MNIQEGKAMIVLNVTYQCKPGMNKTFLEQIKKEGLDVACRAEEGCIKYDYYFPENGCDELFLFEKWQDETALEKHGKQAHFARIGELKTEYVEDTLIEKYVSQ